ncbi:hypothetical protein QTG56_25695 (plasmid) [Rossellomorea sp. AcN35-11]|nr:hypothetical protein [Rossellomorea aquimaris]WJV32010.1 hypothetical protein QTG56_25695 [Rossellomorea sp. AcN35-11]
MGNPKLNFNQDQKEVVEREIKQAYSSMATLLEWVKDDSLSEDMKETLPKLVDNYMNTVKETIGFTGKESEREKEMTESIGQYYQKQINDLEKALESQQSISSIAANVELAFKKIDKWWDVEGFNFIKERSITAGGIAKLELGFMIDSFTSRYSKTPSSDKEKLKTKVEYLMEQGFTFTPKRRGYGLDLIDNDNNRNLLEVMIKKAFPSARIWSFNNLLRRTNKEDDDHFILRSVEMTVIDLGDIEALEVEEKYFLFDEDDE